MEEQLNGPGWKKIKNWKTISKSLAVCWRAFYCANEQKNVGKNHLLWSQRVDIRHPSVHPTPKSSRHRAASKTDKPTRRYLDNFCSTPSCVRWPPVKLIISRGRFIRHGNFYVHTPVIYYRRRLRLDADAVWALSVRRCNWIYINPNSTKSSTLIRHIHNILGCFHDPRGVQY